MDGGEAAALVAEDSAEAQFVKAKTSVWWDIENCAVPKVCDPYAIAQNIISALSKMNYCGPVSISAYGDTNGIPTAVQQALSSTGISLNHVPAGVKDASDKKILVDMLFWAVDNPAPATYLLISGDRDFSNALHQLRMRRYDILLAQPNQASAALVSAAKTVWLWKSLVAGKGPINKSESAQYFAEAASKLEVTSEDSPKKCNQQRQIHQNQQSSGFKRPPPPSNNERSTRVRTETDQKGSNQRSDKNKDPVECYNCGNSGHRSNACQNKKRKCFKCKREGHMWKFCKKGGLKPKPAQSQQESTSYNSNTPIGPASEQSTTPIKLKCCKCGKEGHKQSTCPQSGLTPAQSLPASASYNNLPCINPIGPASEMFNWKEGHKQASCPQNGLRPAYSQLVSASYNYLPCNTLTVPASEQSTTQITGAPVASYSQGQRMYEMCNVYEPNAPVVQALEGVHPMFYISQLRQYIPNPSHSLSYDELRVVPDHTLIEQPIAFLDRRIKTLRNMEITLLLIQWSQRGVEEATWEDETFIQKSYPELYPHLLAAMG